MQYLGSEYRLNPVTAEEFAETTHNTLYAAFAAGQTMDGIFRNALRYEDPNLPAVLSRNTIEMGRAYNVSLGAYKSGFVLGLVALRGTNPVDSHGSINIVAWERLMAREEVLRVSSDLTTVEGLAAAAMMDIAVVNPGYVEGYRKYFGENTVWDGTFGVTTLGAVHAHDVIHFASQLVPGEQ